MSVRHVKKAQKNFLHQRKKHSNKKNRSRISSESILS